jgi:hypothetical protein
MHPLNLPVQLLDAVHLQLAPEVDGVAVVDVHRGNVQDGIGAVDGPPPCLLHEHGHGIALVEHAELALRRTSNKVGYMWDGCGWRGGGEDAGTNNTIY